MKAILPVILLSMLVGCVSTPSPRAQAAAHVRPMIAALQVYHRQTGDYPQQLNDLRPKYLGVAVPCHDWNDGRHSWTANYQRVDRNHYQLNLNSTPCSLAVFRDGALVAAMGPNYK